MPSKKSKKPKVAKMKSKRTSKRIKTSHSAKITPNSNDISALTDDASHSVATNSGGANSDTANNEVIDLTSDNTEGGIDDEAEEVPSVPGVPATNFPLFTSLPAEIQQRIFMEAMRKPGVDYVEIKRHDNVGTWTITMHPIGGSSDKSSYRKIRGLASVCPAAARAVKIGTEGKRRLPFSGLKSAGVDTRHDLVVVYLKSATHWLRPSMSSFGPWHPWSFSAYRESVLDVASARTKLRGIANVGLRYDVGGWTGCMRTDAPFRSLLNRDDHKVFPMCPEEVSGFLDLFPDLERVYLIIHHHRRSNADKAFIKNYAVEFSRYNSGSRGKDGGPILDVFHDSRDTYIEYLPEFVLTGFDELVASNGYKVRELINAFILDAKDAMMADRHPTAPIPVNFKSPFKQRASIEFKKLIKVEEPEGFVL